MQLRHILLFIFLLLSACQTSVNKTLSATANSEKEERQPASSVSAINENESLRILKLPSLNKANLSYAQIHQNKIDQRTHAALENYLSFLGVSPTKQEGQDVLDRLLSSSTQFLLCQDQDNWQCLESSPPLRPNRTHRQEAASNLGQKVFLNRPLKIQAYFTNQFDLRPEEKNMQTMLSTRLASLLNQKWNSISMSLYGIDDLNGSMKDVASALLRSQKNGTIV